MGDLADDARAAEADEFLRGLFELRTDVDRRYGNRPPMKRPKPTTMDHLVEARRRIDRRIKLFERFGVDEWPEDTVLSFTWTTGFTPPKTLSFAALKIDGAWYVTGTIHGGKKTWQELVELWARSHTPVKIWVAAGWEPVV